MPHPHRPSALPGLALAALLLTAPGASANVTRFDRSIDVGAVSLQDGEFDTPPGFQEDGFSSFDQTVTSQIGAERAVASARATVVQGVDSASASASGSIEVQHGIIDEGRGAQGGSGVSFLICVDERSTFTVNVQGNVEANAEDSTLVRADFCCDSSGAPVTLEAGDGNLPRSLTLPVRSGVIPDTQGEDCVSLVVRADSGLGNGGPDTNLPTSRATWSLSIDVVTSPQAPEASEVFLWVAGNSGAFGDPASWDPVGAATEGVPTFVDGVRRDAAVVLAGSSVTMDLAGGAAASSRPRGPIVQRKMGRLEVPLTPSLRPVGGTLTLDSLDLDIRGMAQKKDGRSLEIGSGGTLTLRDARVVARHVAVGSGGEGTLAVEGPGGGFTTLGRFGLGASSDGRVDITNGAIVDTAETVLGEVNGKGSARITGQGSLWRTGNIAVGYADDASLTIEGLARVESESAFIDCTLAVTTSSTGQTLGCPGLQGDERAKATVSGISGTQSSTWSIAGELNVGPRGSLAIVAGGLVLSPASTLDVSIGGGSRADCDLPEGGLACVLVEGGLLQAREVSVGEGGHGRLVVRPGGAVSAENLFIGDDAFEGIVSVRGTSDPGRSAGVNLLKVLGIATTSGGAGELVVEGRASVRAGAVLVGVATPTDGRIRLEGKQRTPPA